jgi:phosphotransacetylase
MNTFADIIEAAQAAGPRHFVVAQAADPTILEALEQARKLGFASPVLVGKKAEIEEAARARPPGRRRPPRPCGWWRAGKGTSS